MAGRGAAVAVEHVAVVALFDRRIDLAVSQSGSSSTSFLSEGGPKLYAKTASLIGIAGNSVVTAPPTANIPPPSAALAAATPDALSGMLKFVPSSAAETDTEP